MQPANDRRQVILDLFCTANLAALAFDIVLAHGSNGFRDVVEYLPLGFSVVATVAMATALAQLLRRHVRTAWRGIGLVVGWISIVTGVMGLVYHLGSHFFSEQTLASLVYTAPFAAPLAYTGLGLLLVMNRTVEPQSEEWGRWVLLLATGGFCGNFIFSLADHAQNGFFFRLEWVSVLASAAGIGGLLTPFVVAVNRSYWQALSWLMLAEAATGLAGFGLHLLADVHGAAPSLIDNVLNGAPVMAPLLFPNLALLAGIGIWTSLSEGA